jgi:hypothetical protein
MAETLSTSQLRTFLLRRITIKVRPVQDNQTSMTQTQPTTTPNLEEPKFGFNRYAERLNGRAAMVGFVITLAVEYFTGQGLLSWLGLS